VSFLFAEKGDFAMSTVSRALNLEAPKEWVEHQDAAVHPVSRWGAPIWKAEAPDLRLQSTAPDALPLEITQLAIVHARW
jgi:hypothetical protein